MQEKLENYFENLNFAIISGSVDIFCMPSLKFESWTESRTRALNGLVRREVFDYRDEVLLVFY